jgi:hypothetical protein
VDVADQNPKLVDNVRQAAATFRGANPMPKQIDSQDRDPWADCDGHLQDLRRAYPAGPPTDVRVRPMRTVTWRPLAAGLMTSPAALCAALGEAA